MKQKFLLRIQNNNIKPRWVSSPRDVDIKYVPVEVGAARSEALRLPVDFPRGHVNFLPPWAYGSQGARYLSRTHSERRCYSSTAADWCRYASQEESFSQDKNNKTHSVTKLLLSREMLYNELLLVSIKMRSSFPLGGFVRHRCGQWMLASKISIELWFLVRNIYQTLVELLRFGNSNYIEAQNFKNK